MKKSRHSPKYRRVLQVLRQLREDRGLLQADVARKFGAYASFVSKCESGERRIDVVELAEFCRTYGISLHEFLKRAGIE
jgi:transcriptional regulator with XRE-family HTH domain